MRGGILVGSAPRRQVIAVRTGQRYNEEQALPAWHNTVIWLEKYVTNA